MKLTADKSVIDIDNYVGKPCIIKYIVNKMNEVEINLPFNWTYEGLTEIIKEGFFEITDDPTEIRNIHILSIKEDNTQLN